MLFVAILFSSSGVSTNTTGWLVGCESGLLVGRHGGKYDSFFRTQSRLLGVPRAAAEPGPPRKCLCPPNTPPHVPTPQLASKWDVHRHLVTTHDSRLTAHVAPAVSLVHQPRFACVGTCFFTRFNHIAHLPSLFSHFHLTRMPLFTRVRSFKGSFRNNYALDALPCNGSIRTGL